MMAVAAPGGHPGPVPRVFPGRQAVVSFTVPFCTPTEATILALMAPEGRILKAKFSQIFWG